MQQRRGNGRRVQLHLRQHLGHLERVHDVGLAAEARLPFVVRDAELPRLANQRDIFIGPVGLHMAQKRLKALPIESLS